MIQERNSSNSVINSYVWDSVSPGGIGGLLELTRGGAHYDYLYDGKGNVTALTDANQQVVAAYRYDGFGVLKAKSGTLEQPYQFSTKRYYAALGMVKYEYRDYLPALGKWAERDPLGEEGGVNLYGFVGNSPMDFIDPYGEAGTTARAAKAGGDALDAANQWAAIIYFCRASQYSKKYPDYCPRCHQSPVPDLKNCPTSNIQGCCPDPSSPAKCHGDGRVVSVEPLAPEPTGTDFTGKPKEKGPNRILPTPRKQKVPQKPRSSGRRK